MLHLIAVATFAASSFPHDLPVPDLADFPGPQSVPGYQRTTWGMAPAEVRALYPNAKSIASGLEVDARIADMPAALRFAFVGDQLARVTVDFTPRFDFNRMPASPGILLAAFDRLDGLLAAKYGRLQADRSSGPAGFSRVTREEREAEVQRGELWLSHDWEFPETLIDLSFAGNPTVYALTITYSSERLAPDLERKTRDEGRREADLKGL